jgi:DNA-binding MarR family transcriptional regulator
VVSTTTRPRRQIGPIERAARKVDAVDEKRKVLLALAAFADEGIDSPSILELSRRCRVHRMAVVLKLDKLACDGVIELRRGDDRHRERTTYRFLIPIQTNSKEAIMAAKTTTDTTTEAPTPRKPLLPSEPPPQRVPRWMRCGYLPGPCQRITWPALDRVRQRHEDAVGALAAAREAGDAEAAADALRVLAEVVIEADAALRESIGEAEAAYQHLVAKERPPEVISDGAAEAARVREIRPAIEADQKIIRRVALGILDADTFLDERGSTPYPSSVVEAMRVTGASR